MSSCTIINTWAIFDNEIQYVSPYIPFIMVRDYQSIVNWFETKEEAQQFKEDFLDEYNKNRSKAIQTFKDVLQRLRNYFKSA